jgi:hypothetical protein
MEAGMRGGRAGPSIARCLAAAVVALGAGSLGGTRAAAADWLPIATDTTIGMTDALDGDATAASTETVLFATAQELSQYGIDFYADNGLTGDGPNYFDIYGANGGAATTGAGWYNVVSFSPAGACDDDCPEATKAGDLLDLLRNFARAPDPDPETI